ncbi:hypothetical protein ACOJBM_41110 [Rhizobium beringeri]
MTVIVYDRKRELMIADSRATSGSHHPIGAKRKINRIAAGPLKGARCSASPPDNPVWVNISRSG